MIIDKENKQMQMESRDLHYILPAYIRSYLFYAKNEMPERIVFPMMSSVPFGSIQVPIEWVPEISPIAIEIAKEGSNVPEVTPEVEAVLDEKDEEIKRLKEQLAGLKPSTSAIEGEGLRSKERVRSTEGGTAETATEEPTAKSPATEPLQSIAPVGRKPKMPPGGDIGPGLPLSDMHKRDARDLSRTRQDLVEGPDMDEASEKPFEKTVKRDETGKPVVE